MWKWLAKNYPEIQHHTVFVLPQMTFVDLAARIIQKRNPTQTEGRIQKARDEINHAGTIADFLILNPPRDATTAAENLLKYFLGH